MAKFLNQYVKSIHSTDWCRIFFYPAYDFKINKFLIRFNDMHDLICWQNGDDFKCTLEKDFELEEISDKNTHYVQVFFERLLEFGFIHGEPRKK